MTSRRIALLLLLAALAFAAACGGRDEAPRVPKGVLLLVMDTTRGDRCSFNGYNRPTTPCLDEFAKDAVTFRDAWTPAAWTGPAHASLFTGLRPEHHGFHAGSLAYLQQSCWTLAEIMKEKRWATACFTNNENIDPESRGLTQGFERIDTLWKNANRAKPWAKATHELAADWAEEMAREGRPFLLFINDMEPHLPYTPPEQDKRTFVRGNPSAEEIAAAEKADIVEEARYSLGVLEFTPLRLSVLSDLYNAEIASLDREIGTLLDRLRAHKLLDDMLVVITSDHGEAIGEHHMFGHGYDLHRVIRHIPLLVRCPGRFEGGRVETAVVRLEDVMPTILDVCGLPVPAGLDGSTLTEERIAGRIACGIQGPDSKVRPLLEQRAPGSDARRLAGGVRCVYDGRHHYLWYPDNHEELYDVKKDPLETTNLAPRERAVVERLFKLLPPWDW